MGGGEVAYIYIYIHIYIYIYVYIYVYIVCMYSMTLNAAETAPAPAFGQSQRELWPRRAGDLHLQSIRDPLETPMAHRKKGNTYNSTFLQRLHDMCVCVCPCDQKVEMCYFYLAFYWPSAQGLPSCWLTTPTLQRKGYTANTIF